MTEAVNPQLLVADCVLNSAAISARVHPSVGTLLPSSVSSKSIENVVAGSLPLSIAPLIAKAAPSLIQSELETAETVVNTDV